MNQRNRVFEILKERGKYGVYNYEFVRLTPPILRATARMGELREMGVDIETRRVRQGVYKYILKERERIIKPKPKQKGLF